MFLFEGVWTSGLWIRKPVEHKWCLLGHLRSMEDSGAECDLMNCGGLAPEISVKNINMWPRYCSCDILGKNVATFCPLSYEFA